MSWGGANVRSNSRIFRHESCGTRLDGSGGRPHCEIVPQAAEIVTEPVRGRRRARHDPVAEALRGPHRLLEPLDR